MAERHCPFLNREEARCAAHLRVGHLQHAFSRCFGDFEGCPAYGEIRAERRTRESAPPLTTLTLGGRVAATQDSSHRSGGASGVAAH